MDFAGILTQKLDNFWLFFVVVIGVTEEYDFTAKFFKNGSKRELLFTGPVFPITRKQEVFKENNGLCISDKVIRELFDDRKLHYTLTFEKH